MLDNEWGLRADRLVWLTRIGGGMPTRRRRQFVHRQFAALAAVLVTLALLGDPSYATLVALGYVALLVVVQVTAPVDVTPPWRRRLRWLLALGLLAFAVVALRQTLPLIGATA